MYLEGAKLALYCFSLADDDLQESLSGKKQVLRGELWSLMIITLITLSLFSTWYSSIVVLLGCCLACAAPRYHPRFHTWPSRTRPTWNTCSRRGAQEGGARPEQPEEAPRESRAFRIRFSVRVGHPIGSHHHKATVLLGHHRSDFLGGFFG